jgi:DNA-binding NarL/FixJ family response regulator
MLINAQTDMTVVGEVDSGWLAVTSVKEFQPDIVVMDISLPDLEGAVATEQIRQMFPEVRVLALTRHGDQGHLRRLLRAGAHGYVLKRSAADELINAIRTVASGGSYIDRNMVEGSVSSGTLRTATDTLANSPVYPLPALTEREGEVLRLIAWGLSHKEIAKQLDISVKTVEYHKANATNKLGLHTRTDILRYALALDWLQEDGGPD